ncbi:hypothetical protein ACF0H5_012947 [Mactra antiquata]
MLGRRHAVVLMTCLGMLITIGSRAVFTIVTTYIIEHTTPSGGIIKMKCVNVSHPRSDWNKKYVLQFQMAYYVATMVTQVPAGVLAARFSPRCVSGVAALLTSILTICIRFALEYKYSWPTFLIRVLQGLVEGSVVPAFNGVLALWAPKSEKSILVVIAYSGAYLCTFVADTVSGLMICKIEDIGSPLYLYGGIGIVWSLIWLTCFHDSPADCRSLSEKEKQIFIDEDQYYRINTTVQLAEIPWRKIFTSLPLSAIFVASVNRNWIFAILVTQLPQYFRDEYHMNSFSDGLWTGIPHVLMTMVLIPVGLVVNTLLHRRVVSTTVARKTVETIGFGTEGACMLALGILQPHSRYVAVTLICVGVGMSGFAISGYQVNCLDLAPRYTSVLTGIIRMGTVGAVISQNLTAELIQYPGGWNKVFIVAGGLHLFGVVYYLIFASGERQPWAEEDLTLSIQYETPDDLPQDNGPVANANDPLLSRSMRVPRSVAINELEESGGWYLSTI